MDTRSKIVSALCTTDEYNNSEICGDINSNVNGQTHPEYFRRCIRKMSRTNIESLSDDILFEILVRLPAEDIFNSSSFVCRKWCQIIHARTFVHAHLQHSTCGLLAENHRYNGQPSLLTWRESRIEMSKFDYKFTGAVRSSCNGLVLEVHENGRDLYIMNPVTKRHFALPPFLINATYWDHAIAYGATSMVYKVVRTFSSYYHSSLVQRIGIAILTVGVDKDWTRRINTQHLSPTPTKLLFGGTPLTTGGFVHWAHMNSQGPKCVLTLNVETETITQIPVPSCNGENLCYKYFPMGGYLSLLVRHGKFSWVVWEMEPETGEWSKLSKIDLEVEKVVEELSSCHRDYYSSLKGEEEVDFSNCSLRSIGWLKFREVFVFNVREGQPFIDGSRFCIAYNVGTQEIKSFVLDSYRDRFTAHQNSLVWLDGC